MRYVSITEARKDLPGLVDSEQMTVVTRQGKPVSVLMSFDAFLSIRADLELARDPERLAAVLADHERAMAGDMGDFELFDPEAEAKVAESYDIAEAEG